MSYTLAILICLARGAVADLVIVAIFAIFLAIFLVVRLIVALWRQVRAQKQVRLQKEEARRKREDLLAMLASHDPWQWKPILDHRLSALFGFQTYEAFELIVVAGGVYRLEEPHSDEQLYTGCILSHCKRHQGEPDKWERVLEFDPALDPIYDRLIRFHHFMDKRMGNVAVTKSA